MAKTASEIAFEKFCADQHVRCEEILTEDAAGRRTPDYYMYPANERVVVEVKEITPNREEREQAEKFEKTGWSTFGATVGDRVRDIIRTAADQIRARGKGRYPALLLLYNPSFHLRHHTEPHAIRAAMYGFDTIVLGLPADRRQSPYVIDRKSGPKRRMTEQHNTSISAIALFGRNELWVYHNMFAAIPLKPELFRALPVRQFTLGEKRPGAFHEWVEIPL